MSTRRQLHLNAFIMPNGHHEAAWRHRSTRPTQALTLQHYLAADAGAGWPDDIDAVAADYRDRCDTLGRRVALPGELAGAGLDVWRHEPEIDPRLLALPNVVILATGGTIAGAGASAVTMDHRSRKRERIPP